MTRKKLMKSIHAKTTCSFFNSIDGLYVDGAFKSVPKFFHQLFTILCATCIFFYRQQTSNVLRGCIQTYGIRGWKTWCNVFSSNCLYWLRNRHSQWVTMVWPGLEVKPCRLHLGQSWWRKIQSLGLSKQYGKKDSEISQFLKKLFGLSPLPPAEVCDCFVLGFLSNLPNDKRVEEFWGYLLENYIDADSTFTPPVWSECTASSLRTTKACELLHAHFKALIYSMNHKIFVLISALQKIQNETYIKMRSVITRKLKKSAAFKQEDLISSKFG